MELKEFMDAFFYYLYRTSGAQAWVIFCCELSLYGLAIFIAMRYSDWELAASLIAVGYVLGRLYKLYIVFRPRPPDGGLEAEKSTPEEGVLFHISFTIMCV